MAKLAKAVGGPKSLDNANEEGVVSSSSGFLSGDEDAAISSKEKGRGRKAKKEAVKEVSTTPSQKAEKTVKAVGAGRARKKLSNEEETNATNSLDSEVKVQKTAAAATKSRGGRKAAEAVSVPMETEENINVETEGNLVPAKRARKAAKIVKNLNENIVVAEMPAKGRGKAKKIIAEPAVDNKESVIVEPSVQEVNSKPKRQKKPPTNTPVDEEGQSEDAVEIVKEDKKGKPAKSAKVKAQSVELSNEPEPIADAKKTKPRSKQTKQKQNDIKSSTEPEAAAIVNAKKTKPRSKQPKQEQKDKTDSSTELEAEAEAEAIVDAKSKSKPLKQLEQKEEIVKDMLEKSTEKAPKGKAATKRKATNKAPIADNSIVKNAEELKVAAEEEDSKPTANKVPKKEPKEKKPAKATKPRAKAAKTQEKSTDEELENGVTEVEKKPKGRKRAAVAAEDDEADGAKPAKTKKTKAPLMNATATTYNKEDFILPPNEDGAERFNLKVSSWNVAGLRSWLNKGGLRFLEYELPDIFCLQEIKCTIDQLPEEVARIPGYHPYWLCMPGGYAGVAIYSKIMPINVVYGIDNEEFDGAGRMITAEYEKFFLINVYVPNSGRKLVNLEARMRWEKLFQEYIKRLDAIKPVIICGDMNVSHQAIDLANPKTNTRSAGFTQEERDKMSELLALGFVDTFRHLYPERIGAYTYWTYMANARSRNVGWRLDYYIVSERFTKRVVDNCIRSQVLGSDHCPITLFLNI